MCSSLGAPLQAYRTKYVTFELCEESAWQEISEQLIGPLNKTKPKRRNLLPPLTKPMLQFLDY